MSARDRDNTIPSNYRPLPSAPIVRAGADEQRGMHGLTRDDRLTGVLTFEIVTRTPIRIGSGVTEPIPLADGKTEIAAGLARVRRRPAIPGSSIKGTLRSLCEAIGGGCGIDDRCDPPCRICGLFGQIAGQRTLMGRVGFSDALPVKRSDADTGLVRLPRAFQPRKAVGRRLYGPAPAGLPKDVPHEVVLKGARCRGTMTLANVTYGELGLVVLAAGLDRTFYPRIGGGKFAGLGEIEVHITEARLRRSYRSPRLETLTGTELGAAMSHWLSVADVAPGGDAALVVLRSGGGTP